jgi:hypothetical protein
MQSALVRAAWLAAAAVTVDDLVVSPRCFPTPALVLRPSFAWRGGAAPSAGDLVLVRSLTDDAADVRICCIDAVAGDMIRDEETTVDVALLADTTAVAASTSPSTFSQYVFRILSAGECRFVNPYDDDAMFTAPASLIVGRVLWRIPPNPKLV